ncbi:MAG: universal stress protein [Anaerolineales bacterium]|jgi:nucleotide-binding universal stress UspA family protein
MSGIVCAIRGGPTSKPTIARAIALAKETDLVLYFLYIVNLDFLAYTESSRVRVIKEELHEMGDFIVLAAQEKAENKGVDAQGAVRDGTVSEGIIEFSKEIEADYVVLGSPQAEYEENVFTRERFESFVSMVEEQSGAQVVLSEIEES